MAYNKISMYSIGYPIAPNYPMPMGLQSNASYVSASILKRAGNEPVARIPDRGDFGNYVHRVSQSTGRLDTFGNGQSIVGTGVLVGDKFVYTSRHFVSERNRMGIQGPITFAISNNTVHQTQVFSVVAIDVDPDGLDLVRLTLEASPSLGVKRASISKTEQPVGPHAAFHYAGGLSLQISTGDIVESGKHFNISTQSILLDAGPGASGAGLFDHHGNLIGFLTFRTTQFGKIARDFVLLSQFSFFNPKPAYTPYLGSTVRPYSFDRMIPVVQTWQPHHESILYSDGFEVFSSVADLQKIGFVKINELKITGKISSELFKLWQSTYVPPGPKLFSPGFVENYYVVTHKHDDDFNVIVDDHQGKHSAKWRIPYTGGAGTKFPENFDENATIRLAKQIAALFTKPPQNREIEMPQKLCRKNAARFDKDLMRLAGSPDQINIYGGWSSKDNGYILHFYPQYIASSDREV